MVSIIVPVYNVEYYIEDCLCSITKQTFKDDLECIIVDDCGSDKSIEIAQKFISQYQGPISFKIIHHSANSGLSVARNTGIDAAQGEYILFLDSDDEITPNAVSALFEAMKVMNCDFVIADFITPGSSRWVPHNQLTDKTILIGEEVHQSYCRNEWYMMAVNKLYKRSFLESTNLRFEPKLLHEDELWSFQCAMRAKSVGIISEICYIYKIRENSITSNVEDHKRKLDSLCKILIGYITEIKQLNKLNQSSHKFIQGRLINYFISSNYAKANASNIIQHYYNLVHQNYSLSIKNYFRLNSKDIIGLFRDSHYLLPPSIGLLWLKFTLQIFTIFK